MRNIQDAFRQPLSGKVKMAMRIYRQRFTTRPASRPLRLLALALLLQGCVATAHAWTVVVDSAADASGPCASTGLGPCSLRDAITYANANRNKGGDNRIEFSIGAGGEQTIVTQSNWNGSLMQPIAPATSLTVDASTQPGYEDHLPRRPLITLQAGSPEFGIGLELAGAITVRGLAIGGFSTALTVTGDGNSVLGCHIGVDASGTVAMGNRSNIIVNSGNRNRIGNLDIGGRNVISAAENSGIWLSWPGVGTENIIQGNYIGTDITGNVALGNQGNGISVASEFTGTLIDSNLVSGNVRETGGSSAISISGSHTLVTRNRVGTNAAGTAMISNNGPGIAVFFSPKGGHRIGTGPEDGNLVAGNKETAIELNGNYAARNSNTLIAGNIVGTSLDASTMLPNQWGIVIKDSDEVTVRGNIVGGSKASGIQFQGAGKNNLVQGNYVGVSPQGTALPNGEGVSFFQKAHDTLVGGDDAAHANVIAHNRLFGVGLRGDEVKGVSMLGNAIYGNTEGGIARTSLANGDPAEPVLLTVTPEGLSGTLDSVANESMRIEYFSTPRLPDGLVERAAGKVLLGSQTVTTDASGHAPLAFKGAMPPGDQAAVTATATRISTGDTSRFSNAMAANAAPVALPQAVTTPQDTALSITLAGTDFESDPLRFEITTDPAHGGISGFDPQTGTLVYTPAAGYSGPDTFTFTVSDGHQSAAAPAAVSIEVIAADPPDPGPGTDPDPGPGTDPGPGPGPGNVQAVPGLGKGGMLALLCGMAYLASRRMRKRQA
ncbi:Ig-like domain-containing protein [Delftia acidovorans]|uniref:Ig-like domain-containing protein n=1 Tax=Delftia acidovorans TaxID=80866 RepID=UPI001ED97527|nr:Ig-like domain-containing protein [Delftia acidovorans]